MAAAAALATPAFYPAFFFVLEKAVKSAGNAVIPTFPAHCPHGLQHLRHKRPTRRNRGLLSLGHSRALCCQRNPFYSTVLLYTYISRFSVAPHYRQKRKSQRRCHRNSVPNHSSLRFSTSLTNGPRLLSRVKAGTHSVFRERLHTTAHAPKEWAFRMGRYHYPRHELHVHEHPRAGYQNGVLYRFWVLAGCAPEERREPAGQRCAYARRCPAGVAAPLGCVIFLLLSKLRLVHPALRAFPRVRDEGWYHYPRRALRAAETPDGRLSKGLICRFLRLGSLH